MRRVPSVIVLAGLLWAGAARALPSYPVPLYMPEPDYPASMRHTLVKNSVTVRIFIQADGGVRFLEVRGATDPRFIEPDP
ncbi:energy transducer TonB, partial [Pseudomonas syringae pv. actinidifoliorum]|nr:energy transducer TonB [Pseudomonas syringae pv. actinidifoliorum]